MKTMFRSLALLPMAALSLATGAFAAGPAVNWNATVTVTPAGGHMLGNPAAKLKLVEYVSYTCSHCAAFQRESEGQLRLAYVRSGKVSVEVRHMLRDPIDLTVAMLTNCGTKDKFFLNHSMFMRSQNTWIVPMTTASAAQRSRWTTGDLRTRNRAIAADFHFYEIMETRGYDRITVDRCLADKAMAERLGAQAQAGSEIGITGTPSFTLNDALLTGTYEWSVLRPQIDAAL
ncbi:MAG: thioredoxin domain-containing protein [Proteobacteria bacterium]|nr:thioredoxin domain-containing protein [Pseudomonadota bacterium]